MCSKIEEVYYVDSWSRDLYDDGRTSMTPTEIDCACQSRQVRHGWLRAQLTIDDGEMVLLLVFPSQLQYRLDT